MRRSDIKYFAAYLLPLSVWVSVYYGGALSYFALVFAFVLLPFLDHVLSYNKINYESDEEEVRKSNLVFDVLLYLNLPILFAIVIYTGYNIHHTSFSITELIGMTMALGILNGSIGINVAHEIGHRPEWYNQWMSRMLLLPSWYMHFNIEHNRGHHRHVATPVDPASAELGDIVYPFIFKSAYGGYSSAWRIQMNDLRKQGKSFVSGSNLMLWFHLIQISALMLLFTICSLQAALVIFIGGILGFSFLEIINYVEHYGLRRKQQANGRYEPIQLHHSWNSDYEIGRIMLYELTRHSDHHFKSNRKYQVLRSLPNSPELPFGYPGSMLLAMIPPLWFRIMNPKVKEHYATIEASS